MIIEMMSGGPPPKETGNAFLTSEELRNGGFQKVEAAHKVIKKVSDSIKNDIFGQDEACDQLALAIVRSRAGFSDPRKPKSIIMFLGPTGVGKTETAKALSKQIYGDSWEERFTRIDCSQLSSPQSITKLSGSDPAYIGYGDQNTFFDSRKLDDGMVIDFDEIEKAHPSVWRWLLPVMDEGQASAITPVENSSLIVPRGELTTLNFRNSWLVFTSNIGAKQMHEAVNGNSVGFAPSGGSSEVEAIGLRELRKQFRGMPEFLDRFRNFVVFKNLDMSSYGKIFDKYLEYINRNSKSGSLDVTVELREHLIKMAVGLGEQGARKIGRVIDSELISKASEVLVSGALNGQGLLIGDIEDGQIIFWTLARATDIPH